MVKTGRRWFGFGVILVLFGALAGCGAPEDGGHPPALDGSFLLITLDTTRADRISCYGGPPDLTPHLDRLAAAGIRFADARSQANVTNPSHTSIFTGLRGLDAGILDNHTRLDPSVDTLASAFLRAGYRTAAFPAASHVGAGILEIPGFESIAPVHGAAALDADVNVDRFLDWLDRVEGERFFAWLHFFDPHMPYDPPEEIRRQFYSGDPREGPSPFAEDPVFLLAHPSVRQEFDDVRDPAYPDALYRGEIHFMDREIGRLLDELERRGILDDLGILAVADHGESHGEHGVYFNHGGLHEPNLRIPMIARLPGFPAGLVVREPVGHLDIVPTLASLYGLEMDSAPRLGRDLTPLLCGGTVESDDVRIFECAANKEVAVLKGDYKLIKRVPKSERSPQLVYLYDLSEDPGESEDRSDELPAVARSLESIVEPWVAAGRSKTWRNPRDERQRRELERLRALGYLEGAPGEEAAKEAEKIDRHAANLAASVREVTAAYEIVAGLDSIDEESRGELRTLAAQRARELERRLPNREALRVTLRLCVDDLREATGGELPDEARALLRNVAERFARR